jgi:hypothetical protein
MTDFLTGNVVFITHFGCFSMMLALAGPLDHFCAKIRILRVKCFMSIYRYRVLLVAFFPVYTFLSVFDSSVDYQCAILAGSLASWIEIKH